MNIINGWILLCTYYDQKKTKKCETNKNVNNDDPSRRLYILNLAWNKGVLGNIEFHEPLAILIGCPIQRVKKFLADKNYRVKQKGDPIPQLKRVIESSPLTPESRKLLQLIFESGLFRTKRFDFAWSALCNLEPQNLRRWVSDQRYKRKQIYLQQPLK
eukprot:UN03224